MAKLPAESILADELAAFLAAALRPVELSPTQRESLRERMLRRVRTTAPDRTTTMRYDEGDWIRVGPLSEIKILRRDWHSNNQSMLVRLAPGAAIATHGHTQEEECLVLEGEVMIGEHVFRAGDAHYARPGAIHEGLRTVTGCLLFIRSEIPPELARPAQPGGS